MGRLNAILRTDLRDFDRWARRGASVWIRTPYRVLRITGVAVLALLFVAAVSFLGTLLVNDPLIFVGCNAIIAAFWYVARWFERRREGPGPDEFRSGPDGGGCPVPVGTGPSARVGEAEAEWPG